MVQEAIAPLKQFMDDSKFQKSMDESVTLAGDKAGEVTITRAELIGLYLTMKREQGLTHLMLSGKIRTLNKEHLKKGNMREAQIYGQDHAVDEKNAEKP